MPLTLPTHPLAVVPLKLRWPRHFDGVALVAGSIAPDLAYVADGYGGTIHGHAWHAPLWWALPLTLVGARVIRWALPTVVAHLPSGGPLALRDYGVLALVRHRWWVTALSAVLGAASHIVWDAFTHPAVDGGSREVVLFPLLHNEVVPDLPYWRLLVYVSDAVGLVAGVVVAVLIGRRRLLTRWHGPAPAPDPRPWRFWPPVVVVLVVGLATLPLHPVRLRQDQAMRCLAVAAVALLAGSAAAGRGVRQPTHG